jgi:hypothetical protein
MKNSGIKIAGWVTFLIGFFMSSIYAMPMTPQTWLASGKLGNLYMFITGSLICAAGVVLLRLRERPQLNLSQADVDGVKVQSGDVSEPSYQFNPVTSLEHMVWFVKQITPDKENWTVQEEIEKIQYYQITPFVDNRYQLADFLGVEDFATVFSYFAAGERHINRAWSAIVDGYEEECFNSLGIALQNFEDSQIAFNEATSN